MGNVASRIVIGSFYLRTKSAIVKNVLVSLKLSSYVLLVLSISFTLTTLFFDSDAAENPGPETQVDEVSLLLLELLKY